MTMIQDLIRNERGAVMSEYALLLALIALGVVGAISLFSDQITAIFNRSASDLKNAK
jgi:Flp pilus assembly pilin Flp